MGSIEIGRLLDGRYRILERRAAGATATVWAADDEFLRRRVAVKILHDHLAGDDDLLERFLDEARTAATVSHPALVAVYDTIADHPGLVLEWIDGPDLRQRLDLGPIRPDELVTIGTTICEGLAELHHHGLVHRDVKPANILLTTAGRPKLTDFGIATANAGDRTATGVVLGTAKYLAPEQVTGGPIDPRTDVFALAAVLYEALAGRPPWQRDGDLPTALARLDEDPADLRRLQPGVNPTITTAVMQGLARHPDHRWPSATAFADALAGRPVLATARPATAGAVAVAAPPAIDHTTPLHRPALPPPPGRPGGGPTRPPGDRPRRPRRRRWPRIVGSLTLAGIAVLGWILITGGGAGGPGTSGAGDPRDPLALTAATAFDPEGTGPAGEHDAQAPRAIDGDPDTAWTTERYDDRTMGAKSGVGLIVMLDGEHDVDEVTVHTAGATDWAASIHLASADTAAGATTAADFGPAVGGGSGLGAEATLAVGGRAGAVLVWITDLGAGPSPYRLAVTEVTVR